MKYIIIFLFGFIFAKCEGEKYIIPICKTCYNVLMNWEQISKMPIK